jgi:cytochrome c-type biogenesis protein CcmH
LLTLNPPPQVRSLLERQIQDINQQLGETAKPDMAAATMSARKIVVKVTLSAALKQQLQQPVSLFVLARNPKQPGPPLAVQRHLSNELPLQLELTTADAMLPTRSIANAQDIEIVARLSASGTPTEQSGDYFGSVPYSFVKQGEQGSVAIEINQRVP